MDETTKRQLKWGLIGCGVLGVAGFGAARYRVARASEYIVRTGIFIDKVRVDKKALQLPFQTAKTITVQPSNYTFHLQAMSKEKMEYILPAVFTVGPRDEPQALLKYATLLSDTTSDEFASIIKGIIEGETRVLTSALSLEELFSGRDEFREKVIEKIDGEMAPLGLRIHNANIQEMADHEGSEYFKFLRQRARANAENVAKISIAEAKKEGDIAIKLREQETRIKTAEYEAVALLSENNRNLEIARSNAELQIQQANLFKTSEIAKIEAKKAAAIRESELQKDVEVRKIQQEMERLRSELLTRATVEAETKQKDADADLYVTQKGADADFYSNQKKADATLYAKQTEATGVLARFEAESEGLQKLLASNDDRQLVMQYLMIDRGLFPELANANAKAIQGLQPKINVWNTSGGANQSNPLADIMKNMPPLIETIYQQTGMKPPAWMCDTDGMHRDVTKIQ